MSGARRSDAEQRERKCRAIALKAEGNPEGRGVSVFLLDWLGITPRGVVAKPERQVLAELFTSMLAVSPNVQYHPIVGQSN